MDILLDTNILARYIEPRHPHYAAATEALRKLGARNEPLCIVPQVLYEFFVVCTRPQQENGGLGLSNKDAVAEIQKVRALFHFLDDSPAIYKEWMQLVETHRIIGKRAHDARLIAAMIVHQVPALLTFNHRHFGQFVGIKVIDPERIDSIDPSALSGS